MECTVCTGTGITTRKSRTPGKSYDCKCLHCKGTGVEDPKRVLRKLESIRDELAKLLPVVKEKEHLHQMVNEAHERVLSAVMLL